MATGRFVKPKQKNAAFRFYFSLPGRNTAEVAEKYLKKGSEITIEGKLVNRQWEDKNGE